jgi:hypothetical protein
MNARLSGTTGDYVTAVAGIESHVVRPLLKRAVNLRTNDPPANIALRKVEDSGGFGSVLTDQILDTPATFTFSTTGASLPVGVYFGNVYDANFPTVDAGYTPANYRPSMVYPLPINGDLMERGKLLSCWRLMAIPRTSRMPTPFSSWRGCRS